MTNFKCTYCCNEIIKSYDVSCHSHYSCKDCKCEYYVDINQNIIKVLFRTNYQSDNVYNFYTIEVNKKDNVTQLLKLDYSDGSLDIKIIYSCNYCANITPQNVNAKIASWLLMI